MTTLKSGRFLSFCETDGWEYVERSNCQGAVVILAIAPNDHFLFVEQYRPPLGKRVIELPAGLYRDEHNEESLFECAQRELIEETGYKASSFQYVDSGPISAGLSNEIIHLVFAQYLEKCGEGGGVDGENIKTHLVPFSHFEHWIIAMKEEGCLVDPKIYMAVFLAHSSIRNFPSDLTAFPR